VKSAVSGLKRTNEFGKHAFKAEPMNIPSKLPSIEARERHKQRKQTSLALATRIYDLILDGHTASEIGASVDRSADSVCKFARSWWGFTIPRSETTVLRVVSVTDEQHEALVRAAADYGTTPAQCLEDLFTFLLDDDASIARTLMDERQRCLEQGINKLCETCCGGLETNRAYPVNADTR
jgi:hypothetical protein